MYDHDLTEAEIEEVKKESKEVLIKYAKLMHEIDGKIPTKLDKQVDQLIDEIIDVFAEKAKQLKKEMQETFDEAQKAKNKADVANVKIAISLIYANAVSYEKIMTKEDYIAALKKEGFSDSQINLVDFTVNEEGMPKIND